MRYIVSATNKAGESCSLAIDARSQREAMIDVIDRGLIVSDVACPDEDSSRFRFRLRDAFVFGFFAGWGMACVYVTIRLADAFLARF